MKFGFDILSPLLRILPPLVDFSRKKKQKKKKKHNEFLPFPEEKEISNAWSQSIPSIRSEETCTTRATPISSTKNIYYYEFFLERTKNSPIGGGGETLTSREIE